MALALMAPPLAGGCLSPASLTCADGHVCPVGTICDDLNKTCLTPTEAAACASRVDGDDCVLRQEHGKCLQGLCRPFRCGDGVRNGAEACDGVDLAGQTCKGLHFYGETTGLACKPDCTLDTSGCAGFCGDGVRNGGEACDGDDLAGADCKSAGFYDSPGLACSAFCTFDTSGCTGSCGDGLVNGSEACDGAPPPGKSCLNYGFEQGLLGCSDQCTLALDGCKMLGWSVVPAGSNRAFYGVWGSGRDDVFAVGGDASGNALALHWDGAGWSDLSPGFARTMVAIWGSGPHDVYAIAPENDTATRSQVLHWDGSAWNPLLTTVPGAPLHAVWGSGPTDVYAVGDGGTIERWDGSNWQLQPQGADNLYGVWGSGPNDVFASGETSGALGVILHGDGSQWTAASRSDGAGGQIPSFPSVGRSIWGSGPDDVFVVGGDIWHFDGGAWTAMTRPLNSSAQWVWGTGPRDVFFNGAADGRLIHWDGADWTTLPPFPPNASVGPLWGSGPNDLYAVGNTIAHWTGTTEVSSTLDTTGLLFPRALAFNRLWGPDSFEDVFAFGGDTYDGAIAHWDGKGWTTETTTVPHLDAIWGARPDDLFAVAANVVLRGSHNDWVQSGSFDGALHAIWGSSANDVYVVGDAGLMAHWDGQAWTPSTIASAGTVLWSIWGSGPRDVFVGGTQGVLMHFDGTWSAMNVGTSDDLYDLSGSGPGDVYAVGHDVPDGTNQIFHWDGARWTELPGVPPSVGTVRGGAGDLFGCNSSGLIHYRLGAWESIAIPNVCSSVHVTRQRVFAVGGWVATVIDRPSVTCVGPEVECDDGWDNDCDGLQDGADPDCAGRVSEQCANLADDDGDGKIDCADPDCAGFPSCKLR